MHVSPASEIEIIEAQELAGQAAGQTKTANFQFSEKSCLKAVWQKTKNLMSCSSFFMTTFMQPTHLCSVYAVCVCMCAQKRLSAQPLLASPLLQCPQLQVSLISTPTQTFFFHQKYTHGFYFTLNCLNCLKNSLEKLLLFVLAMVISGGKIKITKENKEGYGTHS